MTWGEGWHNNHHAHPTSARHGIAWYEIDFNWYGIWVLEKLGLARQVYGLKLSTIGQARNLALRRIRVFHVEHSTLLLRGRLEISVPAHVLSSGVSPVTNPYFWPWRRILGRAIAPFRRSAYAFSFPVFPVSLKTR